MSSNSSPAFRVQFVLDEYTNLRYTNWFSAETLLVSPGLYMGGT